MRKGQATVEFLVTYGWAILALLLVIGALLTSGLLSPSYLISEECGFGNNMPCNFALFNEAGSTRIVLEVFNGFSYKVKIKELNIRTLDGNQEFTGFDSDIEVPSGGKAPFEGTLEGHQVPEGVIKRFTGNITYVSCAPELGPDCSTNEHTLSGAVTGRLIPE